MPPPQIPRRVPYGPQLPRVVREFLATESAGAAFLLAGAVVALVWANSPWNDSYDSLWSTHVDVAVGTIGFEGTLREFVNDGLMTIFFFVVGLEIKRELVRGELQRGRTAALPAIAAVGGMVVPALFYAGFNAGQVGADGWGIPMATDIAFAVGVLALLGPRVPPSLKLFLLTLAIVDDIGAILVIAVFYSESIDFVALAVAVGLLLCGVVLWRMKVQWPPLFIVLGVAVWLAVYDSGVHATIAGVVLALLAPANPAAPTEVAADWAQDLARDPSPRDLQVMVALARSGISVVERLEHLLHPVASFAVVPLFAVANAGLVIEADALADGGARRVALGVVVGLVAGKAIGISLASWLAVRLGISLLPDGAQWRQLVGVAALAGIGFTVSLFVNELAFDAEDLTSAAQVAILAASALAALLAGGLLLGRRRPSPSPSPSPSRMSDGKGTITIGKSE